MGDRVSVTLTIRQSDFIKHKALFEDEYFADFEGVDFFDVGTDGTKYADLQFNQVNYGDLSFESELCDKRVPYDKSWTSGDEFPSGVEHVRLTADGKWEFREFYADNEGSIDIDAAINAYRKGEIAVFLESKKRENSYMSWADQEVIMQGIETTERLLLDCDHKTIGSLVVEMAKVLSLQNTNSEKNKTELTEDEDEINISTEGKEVQIKYLLDSGYLSDCVTRHAVPLYQLDLA